MSDSFADLWNSSAPQKKQQTLSSLAQQQQQRRPQQAGSDLFTLLSSTSSTSTPVSNAARSSPSLRSLAPSSTSIPPPQQQRQQQSPAQNSTNDAFSDLFSSSSSSSNQNLTIAQRTALVDKQRKEAFLAHHGQREKEKSAWAGLDSLGTGGGFTGLTPTNTSKSVSQSKPAKMALADDDDDWGLEDFSESSRTTTTKPLAASSQDKPVLQSTGDAWDFDNFGSSRATSTSKYNNNNKSGGGGNLWNLDEFSSPSTSTQSSQAQRKTATSHTDSPSNDFDFGNGEDGLLNDHDGDVGGGADAQDDDFMSVFNEPPQPEPRQQPQPTSSPATSSPAPTSTTRSASPPPHILGQVVEMGFSIPKAKAALAANNNDVQAAIDQLLASEGGYTGGSGRGSPATNAPRRDTGSSNGSPAPAQAPRRRNREREPQQQHQRRGDTSSPASSSMGGSNDIQAQAEQLFAQASEIGRGMFTKASTFWKEKKEQVQKVYDEHRASSAASGASGSGVQSGRPKWMQQNQGEDGDRDFEPSKKGGFIDDGGGFRDGVGGSSSSGRRAEREREKEPEVWIPKRPDRQRERERQRAREREAAVAVATPPPPPVEEPEVDLFAPAPSAPSQLQTLESDLFQSSTPSRSSQPRNQPPSTRPQPSSHSQPPPKFQRNTTPIPSSIVSIKLEANATFKLGQFGNAEAQYTRAIDSLRSSASGDNNNLYFVLLLNNRANAKMKTGDINGAVKDCEAVIELITTNQLSTSSDDFDSFGNSSSTKGEIKIDWDPTQDTNNGKLHIPVSSGGIPEEETVDLSEGLIKAIKRRAEAYEGMEKWNQAKKDWEWLRSVGWVRESVRGEAGRGVGRCVRMVGGSGEGGSSAGGGLNSMNGTSSSSSSRPPAPAIKPRPKPSPRPTPSTSTTTDTKPSEALQALRTSTAQAEAEDQAKHELKDSIDAKLSAWKSGKETNIRALLASLDTILWEELVNSGSAVKVGMHELVTPAQVKVKYMKAVAKVHPDKLNTTNSTLEQRMIAQGVFGALTDAWNAFKQ